MQPDANTSRESGIRLSPHAPKYAKHATNRNDIHWSLVFFKVQNFDGADFPFMFTSDAFSSVHFCVSALQSSKSSCAKSIGVESYNCNPMVRGISGALVDVDVPRQ